MTPDQQARGEFRHGSLLDGNFRLRRVNSQRKSTACSHCDGKGQVAGARGRTFRRCKPCKGTGRAPLPAEVIVARTRPSAAKAALLQEARDAREAVQVNALRQEVEAQAADARKPIETICGFPLPVEFGRGSDTFNWISFGVPLRHHLQMDWPGSLRDASAFATVLNALPLIRDTLLSIRANARDPETDSVISAEDGANLEACLRAMGERL